MCTVSNLAQKPLPNSMNPFWLMLRHPAERIVAGNTLNMLVPVMQLKIR